ncbi:unnamed protein product [Candida verbasci]|uniref:C2H2-type domain-containing protein n=1 Tax=Candida verbasci TaxID=1227364 RepID=A0A9W4TX93_9ASCO|nr:unnamed protein product [Candida verbasci]
MNQIQTQPPKKKKRSLGTFPCQHCGKVFSRSDHLARHNLNHEPKEVYICDILIDYNGKKIQCGKTFVRKDLKERHIKRHYELMNNQKPKESIPVILMPPPIPQQPNLSYPINKNSSMPQNDIINWLFDSNQYHSDHSIDPSPVQNATIPDFNYNQVFYNNDNPLDDLFKNDLLPSYLNLNVSSSPTNTLDSDNSSDIQDHGKLNIETNQQFFIDNILVNKMLNLIKISPNEINEENLEDRFSLYLCSYWKYFHPQFPIIHKPSFNTKSTELLLLLAMIIVGAQYGFPVNNENLAKLKKKSPEFKISLLLIKPLRFVLFEHEDFKSPVKLWVLQSLNMIEWVEKNFLTRSMHERAHLHHGTLVQLLRRSPILGGNPIKKGSTSSPEESEEEMDTTDSDLFIKWVESESMKRITFMTFYQDITDYIKFRHNPQILFHQLQLLNLPCDDLLWETNDQSFKKLVKKQKRIQGKKIKTNFLSSVKNLLKSSELNQSIFIRKVLLAGLISLMYQMQQIDLQNNSIFLSITHANNNVWKEIIIQAFDNFQVSEDTISIHYLTQIIGLSEINHYDIAIFGGSPANQSVSATMKDHYTVQQKMNNIWKNKPENLRSIIYCYKFLWHIFLDSREDFDTLTSMS